MPDPTPTSRPATRQALFDFLTAHGVAHQTTEHAPVFTVDEGAEIQAALPGAHTKNLFLKDAKGQLWLVCALDRTHLDLKRLARAIGAARLSFGSPDLLNEALGVAPGSVTVFALINDPGHRVRLVLERALLDCEPVNFHPLSNTATTAISSSGLERFLAAVGVEPLVVDFLRLQRDAIEAI